MLTSTLDAALARSEAAFPGLRPGTQKVIRWAGAPGRMTDWALVYLHGFSATRVETAPVSEEVAGRTGSNLFLTRLKGHGLDGPALGRARARDWLEDAHEALEIGRRIGRRVCVVGCSTGATASVVLAGLGGVADAYVMISPNFGMRHPWAGLLDWPGAELWLPLVAGRTRGFVPRNEAHAAGWTSRYPMRAAIEVSRLVRTARAQPVEELKAPVLALFRDTDRIVEAGATWELLARWGGDVSRNELLPRGPRDDPDDHVIAGRILSPDGTAPAVEAICRWLSRLPSGRP